MRRRTRFGRRSARTGASTLRAARYTADVNRFTPTRCIAIGAGFGGRHRVCQLLRLADQSSEDLGAVAHAADRARRDVAHGSTDRSGPVARLELVATNNAIAIAQI